MNEETTKLCICCRKPIIRKEYESNRDFNRRSYCNKECFNNYRLQKRKERLLHGRFGKITVIAIDNDVVTVQCDCGTIKKYALQTMLHNPPTHCGCNNANKTHGMSKHPLYKSWQAMKRRCNNPDEYHEKYYDNIKVCDEWNNSFELFRDWALDNGYVYGYTIERINIYDDYKPTNCTWIPMVEQHKNTRVTTHLVIDGIDKSYAEWGRITGIKESTIRARVNRGWVGRDVLKPIPKK